MGWDTIAALLRRVETGVASGSGSPVKLTLPATTIGTIDTRMIQEILPPDAYRLLQTDDQAVLIDVRSTMEFQYVGHPLGALHVPFKEPPSWDAAPGFVDRVREALTGLVRRSPVEALPVLMMCRSGQRSLAAGRLLEGAGFSHVYNVLEGFEGDRDGNRHRNTINGWRFHQLPWEQS